MKKVNPSSVRYRETVFGKSEVTYDCPECGQNLKSPLSEAGIQDHCPHCECEFIVPGQEKVLEQKNAKQKEANKIAEEANRIAENERKAKQEASEQAKNQELHRVKYYPRSTHYIASGLYSLTLILLNILIYFIGAMYIDDGPVFRVITGICILINLIKAVYAFGVGSKVDETSDLPNRY